MQQGRKVNGNCLQLRERNEKCGVTVNNRDGLFTMPTCRLLLFLPFDYFAHPVYYNVYILNYNVYILLTFRLW